jgi:methionyl-tRNA synthetase
VARANEYVQRESPWLLAKDSNRRRDLERILASLIRRVSRQALALAPFIPAKSQQLWAQLGGPGEVQAYLIDRLAELDPAGWRVKRGEALFPETETTLRTRPTDT